METGRAAGEAVAAAIVAAVVVAETVRGGGSRRDGVTRVDLGDIWPGIARAVRSHWFVLLVEKGGTGGGIVGTGALGGSK